MKQSELRALQLKWYKKLAASGFKDVEANIKYKYPGLKEWATSLQFQYTPQTYVEKERYYQLATQLLHEDVWRSPKDKKLWELYSDGMPFNEMAKVMKMNVRTIHRRIKYYSAFIKS